MGNIALPAVHYLRRVAQPQHLRKLWQATEEVLTTGASKIKLGDKAEDVFELTLKHGVDKFKASEIGFFSKLKNTTGFMLQALKSFFQKPITKAVGQFKKIKTALGNDIDNNINDLPGLLLEGANGKFSFTKTGKNEYHFSIQEQVESLAEAARKKINELKKETFKWNELPSQIRQFAEEHFKDFKPTN